MQTTLLLRIAVMLALLRAGPASADATLRSDPAVAGLRSTRDWPTYMHDAARSGVSGEALALPVAELWTYAPPAEPTRAWPDPHPQARRPELPKIGFDNATHVALAGDTVYFGSSVDNGVHALDASTGARRWTFFTEGPVRLAPSFAYAASEGKPTVAEGRVYAGSDDGAVYCIEAQDGRLAWSARPMDGATRILGAGRVMSLWPVRTGVLVDGGVVYGGAGLFPSHGAGVFALDAATGKPVWKASQTRRATVLPLSPQGYLLLSADQVYVPCGRGKPLSFARADGALRALIAKGVDQARNKGGDYGVLVGDLLYLGTQNILYGYKPDGEPVAEIKDTRQLVATSNRFYRLSRPLPPPNPKFKPVTGEQTNTITAVARAAFDAAGRQDTVPEGVVLWTYEKPRLQTIIVAGPNVVVGGANEVIALDATTGKEVWKTKVDGLAKGLAVANGRLVVSTDKGRIHCFGKGTPAAATAVARSATLPNHVTATPFPADEAMARASALADAIAKDARVERGYGLVIGGDGTRLAYELAKRTGLLVHVIETDPEKAAKTREALAAAGVYGTKVVVDAAAAASGGTNELPYPPYFANLVVVAKGGAKGGPGALAVRSARAEETPPARSATLSVAGRRTASDPGLWTKELLRVLKPCGGVLYAGPLEGEDVPSRLVAAWTNAGAVTEFKLAGSGTWTKLVRGRLPGARDWTHQRANAGNTGSSDDARVRGMPDVLWCGEPGPDKMQETHLRTEAPLVLDGRVFVQGLRSTDNMPILLSFDAYNGVPYWERDMPGAERLNISGDCGNLACSSQGLFVATGNQCHRLDLLTGETRAPYETPPRTNGSAGAWAYVAVEGDTLVGSASSGTQFSDTVFAYDLHSGKLKWRYDGSVIRNGTLAIQGGQASPEGYAQARQAPPERNAQAGTVFLVESAAADGQAKPPVAFNQPAAARALEQAKRRGAEDETTGETDGETDREMAVKGGAVAKPCVRTVVALDLATGGRVWSRDVDLAGCGDWINELCLIAKDDVILLCGMYSAYYRPRGEQDPRRALALSANDGATLWDKNIGNHERPIVVGERVIGRPNAFDLRTGAPVMRDTPKGAVPWTHNSQIRCGEMSASAGMLFFRSGTTAMLDVDSGKVTGIVGLRPGCLVNIIPAGGVIVQTAGDSGCLCPYPVQATVVFVPPGAE